MSRLLGLLLLPAAVVSLSCAEPGSGPAAPQAAAPHENAVKSFVFTWFAWLDRQADEKLLLEHLSSDDLVMTLPEGTLRSRADFSKWYQGVRKGIRGQAHQVGQLQVAQAKGGGYDVRLSVRRRAETADGKRLEARYSHEWHLALAPDGTLLITRYKVQPVK